MMMPATLLGIIVINWHAELCGSEENFYVLLKVCILAAKINLQLEKHRYHVAKLDAVASQFTNKDFVKMIELALDFNTDQAEEIYISPELFWSTVADIQYVTIKLTRLRPPQLNKGQFSNQVRIIRENHLNSPLFSVVELSHQKCLETPPTQGDCPKIDG